MGDGRQSPFAAGSAYPSRPALGSVAVRGIVIYVTSQYAPSRARPALWVAFGLLVLFQGVTRLFYGLHWASDIAVGWVTGGVWTWTCIAPAYDEPRQPAATGDRADR